MTNRDKLLRLLAGQHFLHLLNQPAFYQKVITEICEDHARITGDIEIFWNSQHLSDAFNQWQSKMAEWLIFYSNLQDTQSQTCAPDADLSHIKSVGVLLYCLTQTEHQPIEAVLVSGILPGDLKNLIEAYPNEYFCFLCMYHIFNFQQHDRNIEARYDFANPPLHFRYLRSMVYYLRGTNIQGESAPRTAEDFYMIFKTMDLFGLKENYSRPITMN